MEMEKGIFIFDIDFCFIKCYYIYIIGCGSTLNLSFVKTPKSFKLLNLLCKTSTKDKKRLAICC